MPDNRWGFKAAEALAKHHCREDFGVGPNCDVCGSRLLCQQTKERDAAIIEQTIPTTEHVLRVSIADADFPAYGAYCSPSARDGQAQIILNFSLIFATAAHCKEKPERMMAETGAHEVFHALQDLFGKAFSESDVETLTALAQGIEVAEGDFEDSNAYAEGIQMGQELLLALEGLIALHECNGGCKGTEQYLQAKAAVAKARGENHA